MYITSGERYIHMQVFLRRANLQLISKGKNKRFLVPRVREITLKISDMFALQLICR